MAAVESVSVAARRRSRGARFLVLGFLTLAVSVGLVFHPKTTPPAQAFTVPPVPVVVGSGGLAGAPGAGGAAAGVCATGVGCLALGAVMVGLTLYMTKDSWMPWVKEHVNFNVGTEVPANCVSLTSAQPSSDGGRWGTVIGSADVCSAAKPYGSPATNVWIDIEAVRCIATVAQPFDGIPRAVGEAFGTGIYNTAGSPERPLDSGSGFSGTATVTFACPEGSAPFDAQVRARFESGQYASPWGIIRFAIPDVAFKTDVEVECQRADGSTFQLTDGEVGHPERVSFPSCINADPSSHPTSATVNGPHGGEPLLTYAFPDVETDYPNCFGPSGLLCKVQVTIDGLPCSPGMVGCVQWHRHVRLDNDIAERLDCRFGEYVVPWGNCEPLKRAYIPDAQTQTITTTTVMPEPEWEPYPDPPGYPDPENPNPTPTPTPSGPPTTGPNPLPPPVTPDTPPDSHGCLGSSWSYNPVSWVYAPVKCALIWAFVPKTPISTRLTSMKNAFATKPPFSWVTAIGGLGSPESREAGGTGSRGVPIVGCPNWKVKVNGEQREILCGTQFGNAIVGARPILYAFMVAIAFQPMIRSLMYASVPVLKARVGSD